MKVTLYHGNNHHTHRVEGQDAVDAFLATGVQRFWLDVESPDVAGVRWLAEHFQFHPLALEDLLLPNYRPKLTAYEGHLFLVAHVVSFVRGEVVGQEVHAFLTHESLVTVHEGECQPVASVQRMVAEDPADLGRGPDRVLYLLLDEIADSYFIVSDSIDEVLDELEASVLRSVEPSTLDKVFGLRRGLTLLRRLSTYQRDALSSLLSHEGTYLRRGNVLYLHDVQNLMVTVHEIVDSQRDLTSSVLEVYLSASSFRLGDVMKRLTLVATVFLPISFIAGLFGTNFIYMPFDNVAWFALFVTSLVVTAAGMLLWFRRSGWL